MSEHRFAVLIDGENVSPKSLSAILAEINRNGEIVVCRVYGDWTDPHMGSWKLLLQAVPIRPIQQFRYGENATDGALIMDAIELVSNDTCPVNAFCIVSSDSDYYSLALRLREHGMYVMGIGRQGTKGILVRSCNRFVYLENLAMSSSSSGHHELNGSTKGDSSFGGVPVEEIVFRAYRACELDNDGWVLLANLGHSIRKEYPDFDPRSYNYTNLLDLLRSYSDLFEVRNNGKTPPVYWMRTMLGDNGTKPVKIGTIKRFLGNYGFIKSDEGDYFFTVANLSSEQRGKQLKGGTKVSFTEIKAPDPSGDTTADRNGRAGDVVVHPA